MVKEKPYSMHGTPSVHGGARVLSIREVAEIMRNNPKAREAVRRINRFENSPRMVEKIIHEDYAKNVTTVLNNKFQIDSQLQKRRGLLG